MSFFDLFSGDGNNEHPLLKDAMALERCREDGNQSFSKGSFAEAERQYTEAIAAFRRIFFSKQFQSQSTSSLDGLSSGSQYLNSPLQNPEEWMWLFGEGDDEEDSVWSKIKETPVISFLAQTSNTSANSVRRLVRTLTGNNGSRGSSTTEDDMPGLPPTTASLDEVRSWALETLRPHVLFSNRSAARLHLRKLSLALVDAERAIRLEPEWPKGYYRKAEAFFAERRFEDAIRLFQRSLALLENQRDSSIGLIQTKLQQAHHVLQEQAMGIRIDQLLAGREFAVSSWSPISSLIFQFSQSMRNFVYLIACEETRDCVVVDACWDVDGILEYAKRMQFNIVGAVVTHSHFDHTGGHRPPPPYDHYRVSVDGVSAVLRHRPSAVAYIHEEDVTAVKKSNPDLDPERVVSVRDGFELEVGSSVRIQCLHTPGHTPGSQCLLVNGKRLVSGDTLFIGSCGRLDMPDASVERMVESLLRLKELDPEVVVYPGHAYGGSWTTIGKELKTNPMLQARSAEELSRMVGSSCNESASL